MNKRIEELAEQAGNKRINDYYTNGTVTAFTDIQLQKFAQLIAQECAGICMEMYAKCAGLPGDGALAKDCAYWIKKDFGVE